MNWNSLADFLSMGGYGLYVWGSYIVTALFMAMEIVLVILRKGSILQHLGRMRRSNGFGFSKVKDET